MARRRDATPALDRLFRDHATALLRLAVVLTGDRGLAEELVQEAFVRYSRARSAPARGAERAYLRRIVVNLSHAHHRHQQVVRSRPPERAGEADAADAEVLRRDGARVVADAVRALPARQRDCIVLRYYAGLGDREVAQTLGISEGSVKSHLYRARAALAARLEVLR
jgi:RNA polymerase sigma-70 factor (ECF subfamily)